MIGARIAASARSHVPPSLNLERSQTSLAFPFVYQSSIFAILNLAFATKALRSLCETKSIAERKLGAKAAARLRRRLADLRAAESAAEIVAIGLVQLPQPPSTQFYFDLGGAMLVVEVNHQKEPTADSGGIDWARVTRVKVMKVEGPHEPS
jgi:hypothetical protein